MPQLRALVRGHTAVEAEDEVRMIGVLRLAFHGTPEAVRDHIDRRSAPPPAAPGRGSGTGSRAPDPADEDEAFDSLAESAALLGVRVVMA